MLRVFFAATSIIFSYLSSAHAALLPPPNSASCVASLITAGEHSDSTGISEARRHFALFKENWGTSRIIFEDRTLPISFEKFDLDSQNLKDPAQFKEALNQQLISLERSFEEQELPKNQRIFSFITGASLVGAESINVYLSNKKRLADEYARLRFPKSKDARMGAGVYFLWAVIAAPLAVINIARVTELAELSIREGFPNPTILISLAGAALTTETTGRMLLDRDWTLTSRIDKWRTASSEPSPSPRWIYRSTSHRMPRYIVDDLRLIEDQENIKFDLRLLDSNTDFGRWFRKIFLRTSDSESWIHVDELLSRDPKTQEPVLSVVIRVSEQSQRPRAPKLNQEFKKGR